MDYKKAIDNTLSDMNGSFRPMSNAEFSRKVQERAEIMSSNEKNVLHPGIVELSPVQPEHKSNKVFNVIAGIAGTAAILAGAVFGLNWLNEHGGLKERGIESSNGAGYSQNTAAMTTAATSNALLYNTTDDSGYVKVDQRYGFGDDLTVHLREYIFDGIFAKISYELVFKDEITGDISDIRQIWPKDTESGHCDSVEYGFGKNTVSCSASYRLETFADQTEVSFGYKDDPKSELFGLTMFKSTDRINEPMITTAIYMTAPDNNDAPVMTEETTVTTDVLVTSEYATTATAEWTDDTTYNIPQVQITDGMLDHTDVTLALGEGNVKILPGKIYDGRILKLKLAGDIDDETHIGIRSVKNPRNIIQGGHKNDDGTFTFSALIDVPDGETDTLELLDIGTLKTEGKPKAIEVINVSGIKDYESLTERVGLDMTQWGMPYETLEWLTLSPFGLEMSFTSDKSWKSPNISVEWTTLNGTVCKSRGHSGTGNYDESTGKYHTTLLIVPDEDTDLTQMKEFSINGLKTKRAEFMPRSFWDIPEEDSGTMLHVETFVQIAAPEE